MPAQVAGLGIEMRDGRFLEDETYDLSIDHLKGINNCLTRLAIRVDCDAVRTLAAVGINILNFLKLL